MKSFCVGSVFGIKILLHWSFFLLFVVATISSWKGFEYYKECGYESLYLQWVLLICVFVCVLLHEFGHALAGKYFGLESKQVTLSFLGGILSLELNNLKPKQELIIAIAGPLVNLLIICILAPIISLATNLDTLTTNELTFQNFLFVLLAINAFIALFNLIPAFPMDGGRIFRALLSLKLGNFKATIVAGRIAQLLSIVFIVWGCFGSFGLILIGTFVAFTSQMEITKTKEDFKLNQVTYP